MKRKEEEERKERKERNERNERKERRQKVTSRITGYSDLKILEADCNHPS
jgi:hypothetical protein